LSPGPSYPNLYQQTWYYTDDPDNHIAITGGTQCLDLKREDGTTVQTWQCASNPQQVSVRAVEGVSHVDGPDT
jgi:hypothetical protein